MTVTVNNNRRPVVTSNTDATPASAQSVASITPAATVPADAAKVTTAREVTAPSAPQPGGLNSIMNTEFATGLASNISGLKAGVAVLETGNPSWSRGFGRRQLEVFKKAHGSARPASMEDQPNQPKKTPGQSLDAMAKAAGLEGRVHFEAMANSKEYSDASEERNWWGLCHAWSWSATRADVAALIDVDGPQGMRGKWFGGEFISRADLGNWMMAVSNHFALDSTAKGDATTVGSPNALQVFQAVAGTMGPGKQGFIADIHNDKHEGSDQTWNQPFTGATVNVKDLEPATRDALMKLAEVKGISGDRVQLVQIDAKYAREVDDEHEGATRILHKKWNMYVFSGEWGAMGALPANDPSLVSLKLPVKQSDALPDYVATLPTDAIDDALKGTLQPKNLATPYAEEFNFFVGTVLKHGVSAAEKKQFEVEIAGLKSGAQGRLTPTQVQTLQKRFPSMANAFAPEAWERLFAPLGLDAAQFGSVMKPR